MSVQPQKQIKLDSPDRQQVEAAMAAEVLVRIPDPDADGGYRQEWWTMQRVYEVAWRAGADALAEMLD
ncbi:MAG: hypothetical protein M3R24_19725 [Chloroflexota bacterium]|nr:hypothetical protein [Chloroflexota bacterium]